MCYNGGVMKEDGTCQCEARFGGKRCKQSKWRHYLFSVYVLIRPPRTPVLLQMFIFRPGRQFRMDLYFYSWCFFLLFSFFSISISLIIINIIIVVIFLCFLCFSIYSHFLFIYFVTRTRNYLGLSPWTMVLCQVLGICYLDALYNPSSSPLCPSWSARCASVSADNLWSSFVCAAAAWNSLPDSLKDTALSLPSFQKHLEIFLCYGY